MAEPNEISQEPVHPRPDPQQAPTAPPRADIALVEAVWEGPLPPPSALRQYEEIIPGSANRILESVEKRQEHSRELERIVITGNSKRAYLGLIFGFVISLIGIGGGIYLIATGHDWAGLSLAGINLTALVGVFVYGSKMRRDERNRNAAGNIPE